MLLPYIQGEVRHYYSKPYKTDDNETIEDITQDGLVDIFRLDIRGFQEKSGKFTTYCGVIAKNKTIEETRLQSRHQVETEEEVWRYL